LILHHWTSNSLLKIFRFELTKELADYAKQARIAVIVLEIKKGFLGQGLTAYLQSLILVSIKLVSYSGPD